MQSTLLADFVFVVLTTSLVYICSRSSRRRTSFTLGVLLVLVGLATTDFFYLLPYRQKKVEMMAANAALARKIYADISSFGEETRQLICNNRPRLYLGTPIRCELDEAYFYEYVEGKRNIVWKRYLELDIFSDISHVVAFETVLIRVLAVDGERPVIIHRPVEGNAATTEDL